MPNGLRPKHAARYGDVARLLVRYGRSDLVRDTGLDPVPPGDLAAGEVVAAPEAERLAADLEAMGPAYVKLGQLLSTRADLIPPAWAEGLARLQDRSAPLPFDEVRRVLAAELGPLLERGFRRIDPVPLASASLAQVHRGVLADGREVAVKVQRPGAAEAVAEDMEVLVELATTLEKRSETARRYGVVDLLEHFRTSLTAELDYRREAANLEALAEILRPYPRLHVPHAFPEVSTGKVLVMELVHGCKATELGDDVEGDVRGLAEDLFRAYLDQVLVHGFFHADPHPGNVLVSDGHLTLVDLGMVAEVGPAQRDGLVRLLLAVSDADAERAAASLRALGTELEGFDPDAFQAAVGAILSDNLHRDVAELQAGTVVVALSRASLDAGLRPAPELAMLGKALMNLDQVARSLDPAFDPTEALQRHARSILQQRLQPSSARLMAAALDAKQLLEELPGRLHDLLDAAASGSFEVRVRAFDEVEMLRGLQKIANRVTMGLVLAALIVGGAMLVRVPTSSQLFGYPSIAIVCFLAAVLGALLLLGSIVLSDRRTNRRGTDG